MLKHAKTSGAGAPANPAEVGGDDWDADHLIDADGAKMTTRTDEPAAPASGNLVMFGKTIAGGALPAYIGPSGVGSALQPFLGRNKIGYWNPGGNGTVQPLAFGMAAPTLVGTGAARNVATTNLLTSMRRIGVASASTAGASGSFRTAAAQYFLGNSAGMGGFRIVIRYGCSDAATVADARSFVGLVPGSGSISNVNPSTFINCIGLGSDSGESTLSIMHNDGSGTATKIALGANFPDHTLSADAYELALFAAPNSLSVGYQVTRLNTGDVASGTITTNLPAANFLMSLQVGRNNGTTALAVALDLVSLYVETDF